MSELRIRKSVAIRETIYTDGFGRECYPIVRVAVLAVLPNPCAGRFVEDLSRLFDLGRMAGERLAGEAVELLAGAPVSYGKGAIVGVGGDVEHGAAMIHPKLGKPMRSAVGGGSALIPSNVKVTAPGIPFDLPLGSKDDVWSFDHFDTMTVMLGDAPRPDEIVLVVGVADGGRPVPRSGGKPIV
jgi:hypothetical protein